MGPRLRVGLRDDDGEVSFVDFIFWRNGEMGKWEWGSGEVKKWRSGEVEKRCCGGK
jgi:hypothetical protein